MLLKEEEAVSATAVSSSPTKQSSPTARQHLSSEPHDLGEHPQTAPDEPREDQSQEAVSDNDVGTGAAGPAETATDDESAARQEDDVSLRASTGSIANAGGEGESVAGPDIADKPSGEEGVVGGGQREQDKTVRENAPTAGGLEQADADVVASASGAVELDAHGGLGAGAMKELGGGGVMSSESGTSVLGASAGAKVDAGVDGETAEVDGANVVSEATHGDGVDEPGTAAAAGEPETISDDVGGGEAMSGGLAEEFFAGDDSSEDELYPGAATVAAGGAPDALATQLEGIDQDRELPVGEQPPSPRIFASSVHSGFRSPVATQRNKANAAVGREGLSEAAKAAVAAALANAASATSHGADEGSKSRKKKKSHKERRRKRSGSKSAGEEDPGVGSRVGRSEADENGRTKRSLSKRHHRKSAVG